MVVETKRFAVSEKRFVTEYRGLSTDPKPTGQINGSRFIEIDTGKQFMYDEDGDDWVESSPSSDEGIIVYAEENVQIDGHTLPDITEDQLLTLYNGLIGGQMKQQEL